MSEAYVIDPSALIQAYVKESDSARVQTVLVGLEQTEPDILYFPEFGLVECVNILWKHVRFNGMPIDQAKQSIDELALLPLTIRSVLDVLPRALELGLSHQLAIYDSLYIVLAESLACPLITVDQRQAKAASAAGVTLKPLTDFPEFKETE